MGKYCMTCHNDRARTGGLSLEKADLTDIPKGAETWEKVDAEGARRNDAAARHAAAGTSAA